MKALSRKFDLKKMEERILQWWDDEEIYKTIREREKDWPVWRFIDGPPYTTGSIHLGTAWNKILKDVLIRFKRMNGFRVTDTPGYDTHGLPIEVVMEKQLKIKNKQEILEYGMNKFINKCREYAETKALEMNDQFKRLGCAFWSWDRPYITLKNSYIEGIWWTLKKAWENGLLYKFYKPQNCCPRCATALAKHEFDYMDVEDTSIYVKFKSVDMDNTWFVIWTTTPWTLVANEAIMANPLVDYIKAKVKFPDGHEEFWILSLASATNLIIGELDYKFEIVERFKGEDLEGKKYIHPLAEEVPYQAELAEMSDKVHSIIMTQEYVSEGEGVGLVHTAPGHGPEDFEVGVANGIPVYNPVDEKGTYTVEGGKFEGQFVFDTNQEIIDLLKEKGTLVLDAPISHEYAHCWRCQSKLVYRATEQWFFKTTALADQMLAENKDIYWVPDWAGSRWFESWLRNLKDWCISRQRFWGIPLSVWICDDEECGETEVIGSAEELKKMAGSCPDNLHRPWVDDITWACKKCKKGTMRRIPDILDVWLDSGSVMWAAQEPIDGYSHYDEWIPADFILEGKDQIRGWFNSLLCSAMVSSKKRNYDACYMHGWVTKQGNKMSKSLGNAIEPEELIEGTHKELQNNKKWSNVKGIETFRFYSVGGAKPGLDLNFDWKEYTDTFRILNTIWNTCVYLDEKANLFSFKPALDSYKKDGAREIDLWILSRANSLVKEITGTLNKYELPSITKIYRDFIVNDLSRWYIPSIRDRLTEENDLKDRDLALNVLTEVLWKFLVVLSPVNPMLTEELFQKMMKPFTGRPEKSMSLVMWPEFDETAIKEDLEASMDLTQSIIEANRTLRAENKLKLKWPLQRMILLPKEKWTGLKFENLVKKMARVGEIEVQKEAPAGENFVFTGIGACTVYLDLSLNDDLLVARLLNDLIRAIQFTRKLNKYQVGEEIELILVPSLERFIEPFKHFQEKISKKVTAKTVSIQEKPPADAKSFISQEIYFCPREDCLAMIKGKQVKTAGKSGKVKCYYCENTYAVGDLDTIKFYFKRT